MASRKAKKGTSRSGKRRPGDSIAQRAPVCPTKAERIRFIIGEMATGRWITGVTLYELAEHWKLHEDTVKVDASEASRRVRDVTTEDDIRAQVTLTLQTITSRAMSKGELRTAIESIKALAGITGVEAPKTVNVGGSLAELLALGLSTSGNEPGSPVGE